jgi:hypothetical protein
MAGCGTRHLGVDGRGEVRDELRRLPGTDAGRVSQTQEASQDPVLRRAGALDGVPHE